MAAPTFAERIFNPAPEDDRSAAFIEADRLLRAAGTTAWRNWRVTFALARWLAGDELALTDPNERSVPMYTDITLGDRYTDEPTGFTGICTGRFEYLNGSTRASLEAVDADGKPLEITVDVGRLKPGQ